MAATRTMTYQDTLDSQYISSSLSSLRSNRSTNSLIVRTYKQATQLYLTKRFREALETLEPIVSPQQGNSSGQDGGAEDVAPVAYSSRGTRTKVWVFYLSLLHAIIELGAEEGKSTFESSKWAELAAKARDGSVWNEIVRYGYGGSEGDMDPDVVVNLATLFLGHMQTQRLNQQYLEAYMAASADAAQLAFSQDGTATPMSNVSSSPKELTTRLKIMELYALHVLPANDEWDYSQQFIEMSDMLDDERKEAFLQALESLKEEKDGTAQRERELEELREQEREQQRVAEEAKRKEEAHREEERKQAAEAEKAQLAASNSAHSSRSPGNSSAQNKTPASGPRHSTGPSKASSKPPKKTRTPPPNMYNRASTILNNLQLMIMNASKNVTGNSVAMMRLLMFMIAFILLIARRDLRERLKRALGNSWDSVKATVGMGTKVSYI